MKSKTVASMMRYVASKLPSVEADAQAALLQGEAAPAAEPVEKESKKSRRARQAAQEDEIIEEMPTGGPNEEERMEKLYEQVGWPLGKKYGHPYDAFKLALTWVHSLVIPPLL